MGEYHWTVKVFWVVVVLIAFAFITYAIRRGSTRGE